MVERKLYEPREGFWITPDVSIAHNATFNAGEAKSVRLAIDDRTKRLIRGVKSPVNIATTIRSRYAHVGINTFDREPIGGSTYDLAALIRRDGLISEAAFTLQNHSQRPIAIKAGEPILRFFNFDPNAILKNGKLIESIRSGKISLSGKFGKDWGLGYDESGNVSKVLLKIKDENRRWIPKSPTDEPISIDSTSSGFREAIEGFYEPVPETDEHVFHILETESDLTLCPEVEGVLSPVLLRSIDNPISVNGFQTSSSFMDSMSDHHIRLEFVAPTRRDLRANAVSFQFLQNGF